VVNRKRLIESIKRHEGYRREPYRDTLGWWTVGFGRNIHRLPLRDLSPHQYLGEALNRISDAELHEKWLEADVNTAIAAAERFTYVYPTLSDRRQEVLAEMAYQLGASGLNQFRRLRAAIENGQMVRAHDEMLDSKWASQTPERALRLADRFLAG